jgi:hypothetical protein
MQPGQNELEVSRRWQKRCRPEEASCTKFAIPAKRSVLGKNKELLATSNQFENNRHGRTRAAAAVFEHAEICARPCPVGQKHFGTIANRHSIRNNRACCRLANGDAFDVELLLS